MHIIKQSFDKFNSNKIVKLLIIDKILLLFLFLYLWLLSPGFAIITSLILLVLYLLITKRTLLFYHLSVAFSLAFIWMLIANGKYGYSNNEVVILGLNIFPLFAWTLGLFVVYTIYSNYENILRRKSFIYKLLLFTALFWILLIFTESIAYHVFGINNVANSAYRGLPFCNCLHAPLWMQVSYFLMGPLFFSICSFLRLRNPSTVSNVKSQILRSSEPE